MFSYEHAARSCVAAGLSVWAWRRVLAAFAALPLSAAAEPRSLELYGRLPHLENVSLSPDGTRVAFVQTDGNDRLIAVSELAHNKVLNRVRGGDQKLRDLSWADDNHLLIETSVTTFPHGIATSINGTVHELFQLQVYDLKANKLFMVPKPGAFSDLKTMNFIAGEVEVRRLNDRTELFVPGLQQLGMNVATRMYWKRALLRVDLVSEVGQLIAPARPGNLGWIVDPDGTVVAEETYDQGNGHWSIFVRREGRMQQALSGQGLIEIPRLLGMGPTSETLLLQQLEDHEPVWRLLFLKDGSLGPPMAERKVLERPIEDPVTHRMIGGVHFADSEGYVFFDPDHEKVWQTILHAFPGERVRFESASSDFRQVIVRVEGERDGYCFELVDLNTHHADSLGDVYEGLSHPLEVRRITYPAADGLQIPAYLTLPRNRALQSLPLIVLPHGGPAVRDTADFNWWSQALADQGYAVLQPNYRGSDLSRQFLEKGFGEWGRRMQTDLSDGVRYLANEGIIDPARVCIAGGSYGGYAALAGVTLEPAVYRCAVSVAGISDIRRQLKWVNERAFNPSNLAQRYWDRFMGLSGPSDPAADAISPIKHVDAVKVPVLLIHGRDDTVVPFEQSAAMYDALHAAHKDVSLVTLLNEDHWLSRSETRLQMLEASVAFLRAHNPPD
jgi:cephalosporin-C deacetylase-like acetyl esterase